MDTQHMTVEEIVKQSVLEYYAKQNAGQLIRSTIHDDDYEALRSQFYGGIKPDPVESGEIIRSITTKDDPDFDYESVRAEFFGASRVLGQQRTDKSQPGDDYESLRTQFFGNHR